MTPSTDPRAVEAATYCLYSLRALDCAPLTEADREQARYEIERCPGFGNATREEMKALAEIIAAEYAPLVDAARERDEAYGYLSRWFAAVAPQCEPFERLTLLCTQVDNYVAGLRIAAREMLEAHSMESVGAGSGKRRIDAKRALRAALGGSDG